MSFLYISPQAVVPRLVGVRISFWPAGIYSWNIVGICISLVGISISLVGIGIFLNVKCILGI